jgi:transcriptional regulator with XRE-family HTH domain
MTEKLTEKFGAILKSERERIGVTQKYVEEILRITNYSKFETGERYPSQFKTWKALSHLYGWSRKKEGEMTDKLMKELGDK